MNSFQQYKTEFSLLLGMATGILGFGAYSAIAHARENRPVHAQANTPIRATYVNKV